MFVIAIISERKPINYLWIKYFVWKRCDVLKMNLSSGERDGVMYFVIRRNFSITMNLTWQAITRDGRKRTKAEWVSKHASSVRIIDAGIQEIKIKNVCVVILEATKDAKLVRTIIYVVLWSQMSVVILKALKESNLVFIWYLFFTFSWLYFKQYWNDKNIMLDISFQSEFIK